MKRILTAAALLLVVAACNKDENYNDKYGDRAVIPPKGQSLRVMTYNIYGARATSPANAADLDAIAEVIRRQNPDFVTLNEVDVFTNRTGKDVHQARDLAEKLGMEWHFSKAIDRDGGEYGDAVLSKYPILEKRSYRLPCAAEQPGEDRSRCAIPPASAPATTTSTTKWSRSAPNGPRSRPRSTAPPPKSANFRPDRRC